MRAIATLALLIACDSGSPDASDPPLDTDTGTTVDKPDPLEPWQVTGKEGSLVSRWAAAPPFGRPSYRIMGLFADDLQATTAASLCVDNGWCLPDLPAPDSFVDVQQTWQVGASTTYWNGFDLEVGEVEVPFVFDPDLDASWYQGAALPPPDPNPIVRFDGEWGSYEGPGPSVPPLIVVTSPDPSQLLVPSQPIELRWVPGGEGDVVLRIQDGTNKRLYVLVDDGSFDLDLATTPLDISKEISITLGRWVITEADVNGNSLQMVGVVEQPFTTQPCETYPDVPFGEVDYTPPAPRIAPVFFGLGVRAFIADPLIYDYRWDSDGDGTPEEFSSVVDIDVFEDVGLLFPVPSYVCTVTYEASTATPTSTKAWTPDTGMELWAAWDLELNDGVSDCNRVDPVDFGGSDDIRDWLATKRWGFALGGMSQEFRNTLRTAYTDAGADWANQIEPYVHAGYYTWDRQSATEAIPVFGFPTDPMECSTRLQGAGWAPKPESADFPPRVYDGTPYWINTLQ